MICITGVPGTGKSTVSDILRNRGYSVADGNRISEDAGCTEDGVVDIDCLIQRASFDSLDAVESHFSHLLNCRSVVILEAGEDILRQRLGERGYEQEKILENVEAGLSGMIYSEALDRTPASRIFRIDTTITDPEEVADFISKLFEEERKR